MQTHKDPAHDFQHVYRVLVLAEKIAQAEGADMDVITPAALFHDVVVYQKNSVDSKKENDESADITIRVLQGIDGFPMDKVDRVAVCIRECSFSKRITPSSLESKVLQDADRLEATGAIAVMRTFSSGGQMQLPFYEPKDPFRDHSASVEFGSSLDLFYQRLLLVKECMHTEYAKKIANRRTEFLKYFLTELKIELAESGVING